MRSVAGDYTPEALADQVDWDALPGAGNLAVQGSFNQFAGYININKENGRRIFYWFFEAQENAEDAPVILWTNGGPGSSGMLGLLAEHGPFQVRDDGDSLVDNEYSWNKLANMLYVEIPSGVGFSYSDTVADYKTGDDKTAVDNYWLVQGWLDRFPQYRSNDFHISSESYGGHYMPQLAEEIAKRNKQVAADGSAPVINFAGFMVGNPYTDSRSNTVAQYMAYWGDQLLPGPVYKYWFQSCVASYEESKCNELEAEMDGLIGKLNPYALDFPLCTGDKSADGSDKGAVLRAQRLALKRHMQKALSKERGVAGDDEGVPLPQQGLLTPYDPCAEDLTVPYLNRADVQQALHVVPGTVWDVSSSKIDYEPADMLRPMMPYYTRLIDEYDMAILIFSGDDDAVCATEGTQWWIYDLGYDVDPTCYWRPWEEGGQVAGYHTRFENAQLAFVTVHSAGHEVPAYQPARAFTLLQKYLDRTWWNDEQQPKSIPVSLSEQ